MNYLKLFACFCIFSSYTILSFGQTEKGRVLLGGSSKLDFTTTSSKIKMDGNNADEGKSTKFEFSPQIGYFLSNGFAMGVELPIISSTQTDDDDKYTSTSLAFAPFARYYFGAGNVKPYLHGSVGFGSVNVKYKPSMGTSSETSGSLFIYQMGGGIGVFLNERLSLDFGIGYSSATMKPKEDNNVNYRSVTSGIGVEIGFIILL
jgi:outer membrane protein